MESLRSPHSWALCEHLPMNKIPPIKPGPDLGKWIWQNLVPKSGQAETIQGELLRANEKLRDEAQRNGNGNWDNGFETLINFLEEKLCEKKGMFIDPSKSLRSDLKRLRNYDYPCTEDELFDRIENEIYAFCLNNPTLIPHQKNEMLLR